MKDLVQVDGDVRDKHGDQLGARAAGVSCKQQSGAVQQRALLDQIDNPQLADAVGQIRLEFGTAVEVPRAVADPMAS